MRRWKLLALKYKRESTLLHEKITEVLISMQREDIIKLNLGENLWKDTNDNNFSDNALTKNETIVLDSHDTLSDVLSGILDDDDDDAADDEDVHESNESVKDIDEQAMGCENDTINN